MYSMVFMVNNQCIAFFKNAEKVLGVTVHTCYPATWEVEIRRVGQDSRPAQANVSKTVFQPISWT
jgi:hypothetical protein